MSADGATMERQVRRLRFVEPLREERFQTERHVAALGRTRVTTIAGIFVVALLGMLDVLYASADTPEYVAISLKVRLLWICPLWLVMLISTYLPGHYRRADWVYPAVTVGICWGLAYLKWHLPLYIDNANILTATTLDVSLVMMISFFTLPIRFGRLVVAVLAIIAVVSGGYLLTTSGSLYQDSRLLSFVLMGLGGLILVSVRAREVTERRLFAQREQLAELNAELSRLNAEKDEFMTIAAHDLRSPLAAVGGLAEALRRGRVSGAEKVNTTYRSITEMTRRMLALVEDYLGAHAVEQAALPVRIRRIDLGAAVRAAVDRFEPAAQDKGQRLRCDAPAGPVWGEADEALLAQILDNFVSNALKFSPTGATIELALLQAADGGRVRVEVVDEGPGVPAGEQHRLFRMFGRTSVQPTAGEKSHGIGLAVTKRLAESMEGTVGCESPVAEDGTGAAFWVELGSG
jgi:signal transduction histidine kinase